MADLNYRKIQRQAKVDNIPLHIDSIRESTANNLNIHDLPAGDKSIVYNLGARHEIWNVQGFFLDEDGISADDEARKLKDKSRQGKRVTFIHPRYGEILVFIVSFDFTINKNSLGKVMVNLSLIRDKELRYPTITVQTSQAIAKEKTNFDNLIDIQYTKSIRRISTPRQFEGLAGTLVNFAKRLEDSKLQINDAFGYDIFSIYKDLSLLDEFYTNGDAQRQALFRSIIDGGRLGGNIRKLIESIAPDAVGDTLFGLLEIAKVGDIYRPVSDYIRGNSLSKIAEIISDNDLEDTFTTRQEALIFKEDLARVFNDRQADISDLEDYDLYRANLDLGVAIDTKILDELPSVNRLLEIENNGNAAAYWEYRINEGLDPTDITRRNGSVHPFFLGEDLEIIKEV